MYITHFYLFYIFSYSVSTFICLSILYTIENIYYSIYCIRYIYLFIYSIPFELSNYFTARLPLICIFIFNYIFLFIFIHLTITIYFFFFLYLSIFIYLYLPIFFIVFIIFFLHILILQNWNPCKVYNTITRNNFSNICYNNLNNHTFSPGDLYFIQHIPLPVCLLSLSLSLPIFLAQCFPIDFPFLLA